MIVMHHKERRYLQYVQKEQSPCITRIARECDMSYSHALNLTKVFLHKKWIRTNKMGRLTLVTITKQGREALKRS